MKRITALAEAVGQACQRGLTELGLGAVLLWEALGWLFAGPRRGQPVRLHRVVDEAVNMGLRSLGILGVLSFAVGAMLAVQGVYSLQAFGAERKVTLGLALSVIREFGPLMTGILVAGRSGSALAARIGTMKIREEIDALTVIGIHPVRELVAPPLVALVLLLPCLVWYADIMALLGGGLYVVIELDVSMAAYVADVRSAVGVNDVLHGFGKSVIFALLIVLIGVINGSEVRGGAESVGRATTRAVVQAISAIVVTDMVFVYLATR